jgi:hypothetical protein
VAHGLESALNELDTAILGIIDVLDLPTDKVADYLDNCLQSSYWQRRLKTAGADDRDLQSVVIKGRAMWLWSKTRPDSRRAYFASGVGHKAGTAIEQSIDRLHGFLSAAELALGSGDTPEAGRHTAQATDILFKIRPFAPDYMVKDLPALLAHWLSGAPVSEYADKDAVGFIQEHVVYRLVWAVEASRLHLQHLRADSDKAPGNVLSLCRTYGVPSVKGALLMQGGIRSRSVATAAAEMIEEEITDFIELRSWVRRLYKGLVRGPVWETEYESTEWNRFVARFDHRDHRQRLLKPVRLRATWHDDKPPKHKAPVLVSRMPGQSRALISSISSLPLGTTTLPARVRGSYFTGI